MKMFIRKSYITVLSYGNCVQSTRWNAGKCEHVMLLMKNNLPSHIRYIYLIMERIRMSQLNLFVRFVISWQVSTVWTFEI